MIEQDFLPQEYYNGLFAKCPKITFVVKYLLLVFLIVPQMAFSSQPKSKKVLVPSYDILMTDDLEYKNSLKNFSCTNRIYLYFTWYLLEGMHEVTAFWINPNGKEENQVSLKFTPKKSKVNNWVALAFQNIFDEKNPIAPSLKAAKLSGQWKVRIMLDGKLLETRDFNVRCG